MSCPQICHREQVSHDEVSPGTITSDEQICRGVYPSDRGNNGAKRSSIPASHLWAGQLSVWRVSERSALNVEGLVQVLDPIMIRGNGEKFDEIRAVPAATIREFLVHDDRAFSVLDECVMDGNGNKHPAHAHIAICEVWRQKLQKGDDDFLAMQEGLKLLFETTRVWVRPN